MKLKNTILLVFYVGGAWFSGFLRGQGNDIARLASAITFLIGTVYIVEAGDWK